MLKVVVIIISTIIIWNVKNIDYVKIEAASNYPKILKQVQECVQQFTKELGNELHKLSTTMTRRKKIQENFDKLKDKIHYKKDGEILQTITNKLKKTMHEKTQAVKRIAEYAEFLAYHRKTKEIDPKKFHFFNADNITNTTYDCSREKELEKDIQEAKCVWMCEQKNMTMENPLKCNSFTKEVIEDLFGPVCDCSREINRMRPLDYFNCLPMKRHPNYGNTPVNFNLSSVKVATHVYAREQDVLQGVRWTEPLDMIFRENQERDPTLKYQYFASPHGYMRHYPAIKWPEERYAQTYDPRTRSWYTEAMTSPKDILILLDMSGSVIEVKKKVASHIVNNILDTLNDNDFVNIYIFSNSTRALVPCFEDTLVQANEENLRLLRENLDNYKPKFQAEIELGLEKAFQLLATTREQGGGTNCNQAIMLITEEAFFRKDQKEFFQKFNWRYNTSIRVFTYQLEKSESDGRLLEWMACSNKGYFVNISLFQEVREKTLPYLNVMSRPINYWHKNCSEVELYRSEYIWSYLYIDLADRRYTNWLWRKFEGNRQRAIFMDHAKREFFRLGKSLMSESHFLLHESHDYEKYEEIIDYDYMTTVSLPVYSRRQEDIELIGVAGVDIPIKLLNSLIPHHTIGVNGYAFIVTNNGYILMHPGHRREFNNIPKPTFNRVDLLEVEIFNDPSTTMQPRKFARQIVELRNKILKRMQDAATLNVKYALDDMKRIVLSKRRYIFTGLGTAFSVGIALPHRYGLMVVDIKSVKNLEGGLLNTKNWSVHPDWIYCNETSGRTPEEEVKNCLKHKQTHENLMKCLLFDAESTKWFEDHIDNEEHFVDKFMVDNVFMSTHSGLTRWKIFSPKLDISESEDAEDKAKKELFRGNRSIDEDWYKRVVEENFDNARDDVFIYSVPFEISGYEYDTMVTSTNAIFVKAEGEKSPVAAVGVQFNHRGLKKFFNTVTKKCKHGSCNCDADMVHCFILDNNAYVILGSENEYTGRFIGDISPMITHRLIRNEVYRRIEMFDYQAICQKPPKTKSSATTIVWFFRTLLENLLNVTNWAFATILFLISSVNGGTSKFYQSTKNDTLLFEKLKINKTVPTPCDQQMWLFTLGDNFNSVEYTTKISKPGCDWFYVVERIPYSNLLFLATNPICELDTVSDFLSHNKTPTPVEIDYHEPLACYIAVHNNYSRQFYNKECYSYSPNENTLNNNRTFCGHLWEP